MDILTAVLACSLYADDGLVRAIVQSTSASNPYAVIDPAEEAAMDEPPPPLPRTIEDAQTRLSEIIERGGTPLVGLMQVPPAWAVLFGRPLRDLFDPCINISIGTARLSEFDRECTEELRPKPARSKRGAAPKPKLSAAQNRPCIVRKYADAIGMPEFTLVISLELGHQKLRPLLAKASEAPIFPTAPTGRAWGADRLFFEPASAPESAPPESKPPRE